MKRPDVRKTPTGRELALTSARFQDALSLARQRCDEDLASLKASYIVVRDLLSAEDHIALEQDGAVECPRCGRSGSYRVDADRARLVMVGEIFTRGCKS